MEKKFVNVYEDDRGKFISDAYYETFADAFEGRDPVNYIGTIEIIGDIPDMVNVSRDNRELMNPDNS